MPAAGQEGVPRLPHPRPVQALVPVSLPRTVETLAFRTVHAPAAAHATVVSRARAGAATRWLWHRRDLAFDALIRKVYHNPEEFAAREAAAISATNLKENFNSAFTTGVSEAVKAQKAVRKVRPRLYCLHRSSHGRCAACSLLGRSLPLRSVPCRKVAPVLRGRRRYRSPAGVGPVPAPVVRRRVLGVARAAARGVAQVVPRSLAPSAVVQAALQLSKRHQSGLVSWFRG